MTTKSECVEKIQAANSIIRLAELIQLGANVIGDTTANDLEATLAAFGHGTAIRVAAEVIIEKLDKAGELLVDAEFAAPKGEAA